MKRIAFWIVAFACISLIGVLFGFVMHLLFSKPLFTGVGAVIITIAIFPKITELEKRWFVLKKDI